MRNNNQQLTHEYLLNRVKYNPDTGLFTRIKYIHKKTCGNINKKTGYVYFSINSKKYLAHRLAWFYVYGEMPKGQIDHINHIRTDNRIKNLRVVSHSDNGKNVKLTSRNKSGVMGVYWNKTNSKWRARITVNGKCIHIGYFDNLEDASREIRKEYNKYGFHINHGK